MFKLNNRGVSILICSVSLCYCWQNYDSLNALRSSDQEGKGATSYTEFVYGQCQLEPQQLFIKISNLTIGMRAIARGWLNIHRVPTCVKVRATFNEKDMFRTTAYKFQMCTPIITFIYAQDRHRYFYYEWFLPDEELPGVTWDLYFYGPTDREWGQT